MANPSSILAWKIPWTEELGMPQSMGSQRVRHDWAQWEHTLAILRNWILKLKAQIDFFCSDVGQNQCQRHDVSRYVNWVHAVIYSEPSKGSFWGTGSWLVYLVLKRWTADMDSHRASPTFLHLHTTFLHLHTFVHLHTIHLNFSFSREVKPRCCL